MGQRYELSCSIADLRCTYVNELIGSEVLTVLLLGALFFGFCSYSKIGLKTSIWLSCVFFPVTSYYIVGTTGVFAIITVFISLLGAFLHARIVGNR